MQIDTCMSCQEAIELLRRSRYDAIVLDYDLPGMSGIDFLKTIKNQGKYYLCVDDRKETGAGDTLYQVPVKFTRVS
jgi:CheY-like chemotaxis protein